MRSLQGPLENCKNQSLNQVDLKKTKNLNLGVEEQQETVRQTPPGPEQTVGIQAPQGSGVSPWALPPAGQWLCGAGLLSTAQWGSSLLPSL